MEFLFNILTQRANLPHLVTTPHFRGLDGAGIHKWRVQISTLPTKKTGLTGQPDMSNSFCHLYCLSRSPQYLALITLKMKSY